MSNIDPSVPIYENPTTASVRANFATAKSEIEALQSVAVGAPFLPIAGGTLTGALLLAHDPAQLAEAATKNYVDNQVAAGSGGTGGLPEAPQDSYTYGRENATWLRVLPLAGGVLTGLLTLSGPPTTALHAASKGYVDGFLPLAGGTLTGALTLSGAPTTALMAATKSYVDSAAMPVVGGQFTGPVSFNMGDAPPGTGATGTDGTRIQLYPRTVGTDPGLGIGVMPGGMFFSTRGGGDFFAWFANTAQIANLADNGNFSLTNLVSVGGLAGVPTNAGPAQVLAPNAGQALMLAGLVNTTIAGNLYNSAGGMRYIGANPGAYFSVGNTQFLWAVAAAGAAGAVVPTFTQLASLDNTSGFFVSGPNGGIGFYDRGGTSFRGIWYMQGQTTCFANTNSGNLLQIGASGGLQINAGSLQITAGGVTCGGGISAAGNIAATGVYGFVGCSAYLGQNAPGTLYLYAQNTSAQYSTIFTSSGFLYFYQYVNANTQLGYFDYTGNFTITGPTASKPGGGSWAAPSDARLKRDIEPYTHGLDAICALEPISYCYNGLGGIRDDGTRFVGLDAAKVEPVLPEFVGRMMIKMHPTPAEDEASRHEDPDTEILTLDPSALVYALVNAVRELKARIEVLETEEGN
jgi:Chaperone of endosialidase